MAARHGMYMVTRGIFQHVEGGDLARFIGYPSADFGVLDYLVLNHLAIIVRGDAVGFDICVNAQDFDAKNVAAVADYLASTPALVQVRMRLFLGGWLTETFLDVEDAVARLRMIGDGALRAPAARLRLVARDPDETCAETDGLLALWKSHGGRFSSEFLDDALGEGVLDRTFVVEPSPRNGWLVRYMGSGIATFDNWQKVDRPLATKETDHGYTEWVAGHYESALASGGGRYDHVDAIISTTSRQPTRVRYRRRLLPFVSLKGKPLVVGYSALSSDLALPL
jgi:hypothetical protein